MSPRNPHAGLPIADDDATIEAAPEDVSIPTRIWSRDSIEHSRYENAEGKIHILSPWRLVDDWAWTREPELADFHFSPDASGAGSVKA